MSRKMPSEASTTSSLRWMSLEPGTSCQLTGTSWGGGDLGVCVCGGGYIWEGGARTPCMHGMHRKRINQTHGPIPTSSA